MAHSTAHLNPSATSASWRWSGDVGMKKIVEGAYLVHLGSTNAVLLDGGPELALVDAGFPDKESVVFDAIRQLGRTTRDLRPPRRCHDFVETDT